VAGDPGIRRGPARGPGRSRDLHQHQPVHPEAVTYADRVAARIILLDGLALSRLMVRYNTGVQDQQTYLIKRVDEDFFDEN
jgi:restriction endonuclease Mrr